MPLTNNLYAILFSLRPKIENGLTRPPHFPTFNPRKFVLSSKELFWRPRLMSATILGQKIYLVQGASDIAATLRQRDLSAYTLLYILTHGFNLSPDTLKTYHADNSGAHSTPYPGSQVQPRNRVEFHTTDSVHQFLLGPGFTPLTKRFRKNIGPRLSSLPINTEWVVKEDFLDLFRSDFTSSLIDSMCGTYLSNRHPQFIQDLWMLEGNIWKLLFQFPRFLAPESYAARTMAVAAIKDWHSWARDHFEPTSVDEHGNDPFWSSRFFRGRQGMFQDMDGFTADAIAPQDLAFLWGALNNVIVTSFWTALEVFKDPALLTCIRNDVQACLIPPADTQRGTTTPPSNIGIHDNIDVDKLLRQPFLQAVYSESLCLRVSGFFVRLSPPRDIDVRGWRIPGNSYIATSAIPMHMEPSVWSTGENEGHLVEEFYIGRWLEPNSDRDSPELPGLTAPHLTTNTASSTSTSEVKFIADVARGAWMPFGGGHNLCPGRRFANCMVFLSVALLVTMYDCEVLSDVRNLGMSMPTFGFGISPPDRKVRVNMRRRVGSLLPVSS
ncbi:cytochrome P450 [Aspergillus aurantiobrunneus]